MPSQAFRDQLSALTAAAPARSIIRAAASEPEPTSTPEAVPAMRPDRSPSVPPQQSPILRPDRPEPPSKLRRRSRAGRWLIPVASAVCVLGLSLLAAFNGLLLMTPEKNPQSC
jgi:hypothetical protein